MTQKAELLALVDDALNLLTDYRPAVKQGDGPDEPLESLLSHCQSLSARIDEAPPEPIRLLHHFACTGGTLISRAIACQPNTMVVSEVDPFSEWARPGRGFAPSDLIHLTTQDRCPPSIETIRRMFLAALQSLYTDLTAEGRHLVLRDHTHSHFCAPADPGTRPLLGEVLGHLFDLRQVITVRHPLDSFISLHKNKWAKGPLERLDGYAARYLAFLDSYPGVDIRTYERFVKDPETECKQLAELLELPFNRRWQDVLPVVRMSGDSGRKGTRIAPRPRRELPEHILRDTPDSPNYVTLCARLGYDPDPQAQAIPQP
jgi:hypothetical protein